MKLSKKSQKLKISEKLETLKKSPTGLEKLVFPKKIIIIGVLVLTVFILIGCNTEEPSAGQAINVEEPVAEPLGCPEDARVCEDGSTVVRVAPDCEFAACPEVIEETGCEINSECTAGLLCIDGECGTIADQFKTVGCTEKCIVTAVKVNTSDNEEYDIGPGRGSYSYAGAVEWKLVSTPEHCQEAKPLVPINILKKNAGTLLSEQIIMLREGETSKVITHPTISRVKFTATLDQVTEECS
ncbi:MAG: hypothetical protein KJ597_00870 [Nanoarchaeota archaeon]|nr:hypothetical protein [Nanoarchaeota archaeon]MBU1622104.1 hypothetical protein [Nanoarchaeota archaeon]